LSEMAHPRLLLDFHCRKNCPDRGLVAHDPEGCLRIAGKGAPTSVELLADAFLQRAAPGFEIISDRDHISVDRAAAGAREQRERIGPAVKLERQLAQADEIGAAGRIDLAPLRWRESAAGT